MRMAASLQRCFRVWFYLEQPEMTGSATINAEHAGSCIAALALVTQYSVCDHGFRTSLTTCLERKRALVSVICGQPAMTPGLRLQLDTGVKLSLNELTLLQELMALPALADARTGVRPISDSQRTSTAINKDVTIVDPHFPIAPPSQQILVVDTDSGQCAYGAGRLLIGRGPECDLVLQDA